jgi:CPA1 family monovalent cation:H+ antiporter
MLTIATILIVLAALFSYLNYRFIKLPTTIGLMVISLCFSLLLLLLGYLGFGEITEKSRALLSRIDFNQTLMHGMLSFLLFAGALHINLGDLRKQRWVVATLASVGVLISASLVAVAIWYVAQAIGLSLPFMYCLLFGALIAPTDPIAVLGILKTTRVPKSLETKIAGESLFNDGVAVVLFIVLLRFADGSGDTGAIQIATLFIVEALGGAVLGGVLGWLTYLMLKSVDNYQVEVLLTLALVMGGYALASSLHVSGPIAMVVAGLLIGNHGRTLAMSDKTRLHLDNFWELVDEILNAVLFVLIGLEVLVLAFTQQYLLAGLIAIPLVVSVGIPIGLLRFRREFSPHAVKILTWGGLRGGISVALALSLTAGETRDALVAMTYIVVVFSIIVQGLTIGKLVKKCS